MKKRIYNDEELKILSDCYFVKSIKRKCEIEYDTLFKLWCILLKITKPELSAKEIFERGGFDTSILNNKLPQRRIKEWFDNYKRFGIRYFLPEDDVYYSINIKNKDNTYKDMFREKLMDYVLRKLKKYDN